MSPLNVRVVRDWGNERSQQRGCMKDEVYTHLGVSQDSRAGNGH